jgi:hypothetical protein
MENEPVDESYTPSFARRMGRGVVGLCVAYVGLKVGEEVFNLDLPFYMEMPLAAAAGSAATTI